MLLPEPRPLLHSPVTALEAANKLNAKFGDISEPAEFRGEVTIELADPKKIDKVAKHAKEKLGFNLLLDICSIDNYGNDPRWTVVYELYSIESKMHLRIKTDVGEEKSELPTVTGI